MKNNRVIKYKDKVCKMEGCSAIFSPTTGNQKYCVCCKEKAKHEREKIQWRKQSRKNNEYKERTVECGVCGKEFTTFYGSKKYCGSDKCEAERLRRNDRVRRLRQSKDALSANGKKYYKRYRKEIIIKTADRYRKKNPEAKEYVPGRVYRHNIDYVRDYVKVFEYELLSNEYMNSKTPITLKCPGQHIWVTNFNSFKDGNNRCPKCSGNGVSKFELEVREYIGSIYNNKVVYNDRDHVFNKVTNKHLELDIYFPELNKAIECNGEYWHSTDEVIERDKIKNKFCVINGINLLTVTDKEWLSGKGKCLVSDFLIN